MKQLFFHAYRNASNQYRKGNLRRSAQDRILLPNLILDTGEPDRAGAYAPADKAYAELLDHHAQDHFAHMPKALADDMLTHFRDRNAALSFENDQSKRAKILDEVNELQPRRIGKGSRIRGRRWTEWRMFQSNANLSTGLGD